MGKTKVTDRKKITEYDYVTFGPTLADAKKQMDAYVEKYGPDALVVMNGYDYDSELSVRFERDETDKEYENRLKNHEKQLKKQQEAKIKKMERMKVDLERSKQLERELYEQLKKKYGDE